jgi:hypothetical protein
LPEAVLVTTKQALERTAIIAAVGAVLANVAWFLPMRGTEAFAGESKLAFLLHVLVLCLPAAGCGAVFGYVLAAFTLRFGIGSVAAVVGAFGLAGSIYSAYQRTGQVTVAAWRDGAYWAAVFVAFVVAIGGLVRRFTGVSQDEGRRSSS